MIDKIAGMFGQQFTDKGKRLVKIVILFWLAIVFASFLISRAFSWTVCEWYGAQTERDVRYAAFVGCMVKIGDSWVPKNELRVVQ